MSSRFSCCFCGQPGSFQDADALQFVVYLQRQIEGDEEETPSQHWLAHRTCFENALSPEHRIFGWESEAE